MKFLISYILTFTEGILTFISPCILPMLPIYFIYLAGTSAAEGVEGRDAGEPRWTAGVRAAAGAQGTAETRETTEVQVAAGARKAGIARRKILANSIGFIIGFTIVFVLLGVVVTSFGHFLQSNRLVLQKISGLIIIIFGLNFAGILKIGFLNTEKRLNSKADHLSFFSSILFGMVFGFGWTPCLGAFLGSALLLASNSETVLQGTLLLLVYSIGLGIPFLVSSIVFDKVKGAFKWLQRNGRIISMVSGILLMISGIMVFTGTLKYLG